MSVQNRSVVLDEEQVQTLKEMIGKGVKSAREVMRAQVLLLSNKEGLAKSDREICEALSLSPNTPYRIRRRFCEGGIKKALYDRPRSGRPKEITLKDEAVIMAIACTDPLDGYEGWTLDLIKREYERRRGKTIGRTTVYEVLLRNRLKPWREKNVVHSGDG